MIQLEQVDKYKYDQLLELVKRQEKTIEYLRADAIVLRDYQKGDVWHWQSEGENYLESLVCPILIHPADLTRLLTPGPEKPNEEERAAFEKWFKEEYEMYPYLTENMQYESAPAKAAGDFYVNGFIDMAYKGWQARAAKQYSLPEGL